MSNGIVVATPTSVLDAPAAVEPGFAAALREHTKTVHREAERTGFIADLIRGRATRDGYALFLRNLEPVYLALEQALEGATDPVMAPFADHRLRRLDALRADLRAMAGNAWTTTYPVLREAEDYVEAIDAARDSRRLVAHAYARYLGDLSGGQILKPVLARTFALPPEALTFYDFPALPDLDQPKTAMRAAFDRVDPASANAGDIIKEAISAFRHNIALSEAVQAASR